MIKPPFTIIILKESEQPVTLRISGKFLLFVFLFVFVCAGFGITGLLYRYSSFFTETIEETDDRSLPSQDLRLVENADTVHDETLSSVRPVIKNLTFNQTDRKELELSFTFQHADETRQLFVWLIADPEDVPVVHPSSPLFRGLPVDYRNGLVYHEHDAPTIHAVMSGLTAGADFRTLRVLAYSPEGALVVDSTFSFQNDTKE